MKLILIIATALAIFAGSILAAPVQADSIYRRQLSEEIVSTLTRRAPDTHHGVAVSLGSAAAAHQKAATLAGILAGQTNNPSRIDILTKQKKHHEAVAKELKTLADQHFAAHAGKTTISDADKQAHLQRARDEQAKAVKAHYELKP